MKKKPKKLLVMQLRCAPKWWPREKRQLAWVGVLAGGVGWTIGQGDPMTVEAIKDAKENIRDTWPEAIFKIRSAP